MNSPISNTNAAIKQVTEQNDINFIHGVIPRSLYTGHGLHLNYSGKELICNKIKDSILHKHSKKTDFSRPLGYPSTSVDNLQIMHLNVNGLIRLHF